MSGLFDVFYFYSVVNYIDINVIIIPPMWLIYASKDASIDIYINYCCTALTIITTNYAFEGVGSNPI